MIPRYRVLASRIEFELGELERTQAAAQRHWKSAVVQVVDQDAYLNSVALNLHGFYSGVERILELIAQDVDGGRVGGEAWHSELLRQMSLDVPGIRPPVLQETTARQLDEYRRFRHLIRNIYTTNLNPERMAHVIQELPGLWQQVRAELEQFVGYLRGLADTDIS